MLEPVIDIDIADLGGAIRTLQICVGDITQPEPSGAVDLLAISCFPDDYLETRTSIVGQLAKQGVHVGQLALNKARDERQRWQTWVSQPIGRGAPFGRIVCFEYGWSRDPSAVVGNVFRAVSEFVLEGGQDELGVLRVPLLGTGDQRADKLKMLEAIIDQAWCHLRASLPVRKVQFVLYPKISEFNRLMIELGVILERVRTKWAKTLLSANPEFDYFVSYRHVDRALVDRLIAGMRDRRPGVRVYRDHEMLSTGGFWKPELVSGIYNANKFLCVVTDSYVDSGECIDEFHAALCCARHRESFLRPLLKLESRAVETLPLTFRQVNFIDANCPPRVLEDVVESILDS